MSQPRNCTAIKALLFAALLFAGSMASAAQVVGTVTNLSGVLLAKKADGTVKILALKSEVESGDTLVSDKNTYAQLKFIDNSEITLKPGTTFKIENFEFDEGKPAGDNATFSLVRGGLRSITGLLGKRNKEKFALKTPSATIGIRGTTFVAQYVEPLAANGVAGVVPLQLAQGPIPKGPGLAPGLYVSVIDGLINLTNPAGSANFSPGQFGYTPNFRQPPVLLPVNPGIQFVPPPAFNPPAPNTTTTSSSAKSNNIDCEVR